MSFATGIAGLASQLSSCASFDRFFLGDKRILEDETVIIGGGISGLAVALNLKKQRKPYRLYEASATLGGRIRQYKNFELGVDSFDPEDKLLINLLKELKVEYVGHEYIDSSRAFFYENQFYSKKDILPPMKKLVEYMDKQFKILGQQLREYSKLENSTSPLSFSSFSYGSQKLIDLIPSRNKMSRDYFKICLEHEYGIQFSWLSFFQVLTSWPQLKRKYFSNQTEILKFKKSSSDFIQTLADRVQGVVPGHLLRLNEKLVEIKDRGITNELIFKTVRGLESVFVEKVVFALPIKQLLEIKGIDDFINTQELKNQYTFGTYKTYFSEFQNSELKSKKNEHPLAVAFFSSTDRSEYWHVTQNGVQMRALPIEPGLTFADFKKRFFDLKNRFKIASGSEFLEEETFSHSFLTVKNIQTFRPVFAENPRLLFRNKDSSIQFVGDWTEVLQMGSVESALRSIRMTY